MPPWCGRVRLPIPRDYWAPTKFAAEPAYTLAPNSAEANSAMAGLKEVFEYDWAAVEKFHRRSIELNPQYAATHWVFGLFLASAKMVLFGAILFSVVLLFQVVTLPVEFNATARAKKLIVDYGIVTPEEREGVDRVLDAAALTYVAAAVSTLMTLLYFLFRSGLLGGRRDD